VLAKHRSRSKFQLVGAGRQGATPCDHIAQSLKLALVVSIFGVYGNIANAADEKAAGTQVDLQLVVTVDVSRPMDNDEAVVARRGYVESFRKVIKARPSGRPARFRHNHSRG
jgi:Protein of unknown function (DUF1194)